MILECNLDFKLPVGKLALLIMFGGKLMLAAIQASKLAFAEVLWATVKFTLSMAIFFTIVVLTTPVVKLY